MAVSDDAAHAVATRIFLRGLAQGQLSADDRTYLAQVIAQRTQISQAEAEQRIDAVFAQAQQAKQQALQAADTARKVAAGSALWMFAALLCGAFFASFMAIVGGRRRDAELLVVHDVHSTPPYPAHPLTGDSPCARSSSTSSACRSRSSSCSRCSGTDLPAGEREGPLRPSRLADSAPLAGTAQVSRLNFLSPCRPKPTPVTADKETPWRR